MHSTPDTKGPVTAMDLPSRLDITTAGALRDWFLACQTDGRLNGALVEVVTTPALQVLMAGRDHLRDAGHALSIDAPSAAFLGCLSTLGTDLSRLSHPMDGGAS
ncbi:STAS domain-containing protein [Jannaschia sp. 2305UL9-9]|uniref:STAS domain-containing protein n=1 Tax=Jannaschia sp. 2305UL9-9 TaxID=3121638 RepID=UPI00352735D0